MATAANTVYKLQKTQYVVANNTMIQNADMIIRGNLTIIGGQTYANSQTLLVRDNIITLNAAINQSGIPTMDAGIEIDRGSEQNVSIIWKESQGVWQFTNDGVNYETLGGGSAGSYANSAFIQANAAYNAANNASDTWVRNQANNAYTHANAAYNFANNSSVWGTRQAFVATAGQTVFSPGSGYLPGSVDVYYNGLKLYGGEDYTATDGVNITLTNPATVNSIIEVVGFSANAAAANVYVLNSMTSLLNRQTFFATDGQTTFVPSQTYRVGYVDVYYNGLKLNIPEDVTASDGTNIVFVGLTPTTNDVIEVVGLTPNVALANAIPITGGSVSGGLTLAGNVLPSSTNTYYLGSATSRWHSIFVGPGSVDIGGLKLSNVAGTLSVSSPGQPAVPIAGEDNWVRAQANASFIQSNAAFNKANSSVQYSANTAVTDFLAIPQGNTAQRPASAANGHIRYNTTLGRLETYLPAGGWVSVVSDNYTVEYLVVAGGGAGGIQVGGGGGAGGALTGSIVVTPVATYSVVIGAGGTGLTTNAIGPSGSNSTFYNITAQGGGGGGSYPAGQANPGGSGGGSGAPTTTSPGAGVPGQGYPGANGYASQWAGGGGGGAGGPGLAATSQIGGNGGIGISSTISGTLQYYAGGGGGCSESAQPVLASGGLGGGGQGWSTSYHPGANNNGTINTGGGGGGQRDYPTPYSGSLGGSGIVILRYQGTQRGSGGTISSVGGYTIHTFTGTGTFTA